MNSRHTIAACWQVEQGIMAIIGARSSTATKAMSPVSTALHIPQITPTATNPQLGMVHKVDGLNYQPLTSYLVDFSVCAPIGVI